MQRYIGGVIWWRGAPHTAKERSQGSTCVSWGAPLPPYIKEQGEGGGRPRRRRAKGSPTPTGSRTPSFLVGVGEGGKKGRGGRKGGPHPLSNSDQRGLRASFLSTFSLYFRMAQ